MISSPPLKYVGGKGKLVPDIVKRMPSETTVIVEPFCGSAAFSFSQDLPFYIWDSSPELINFFEILRDDPHLLEDSLRELVESHEIHTCQKAHYLSVREWDRRPNWPDCLSRVDRAARYYYIIYAGYNGLYRVNGSGQCNTPYGERKFSPDYNRLRECSKILNERCRGILLQEFDSMTPLADIIDAGEEPFVLIDPPYFETFDQYVKDRPNDEFWERLRVFMENLEQADVQFLMTNSDKDFVLEKYQQFPVDKVPTKYTVAADGSKRGKTFEAWFTNNI